MKREKKSQNKRVGIKDVYVLACTDRKFLKALLKNADKALDAYKIKLSKSARQELVTMLDAQLDIKGRDLVSYLNKFYSSAHKGIRLPPPPPPPWEVIVPPGKRSWDELTELIRVENRKLLQELMEKLPGGPEKPEEPGEIG
jgi:hypothetical protein